MLYSVNVGVLFLLVIKECIAGCDKPLPYGVAVFFYDGSHGFPFLLQGDKGVGGLFPVGRVLHCLGPLAQLGFLGQIGGKLLFHLLEKLGLLAKEVVARLPEPGKELGILLA